MDFNNRKAVHDSLSKYCYMAKDEDFIEITEWTNGEGIDIIINSSKQFSLTFGELDAINYLTQSLKYENNSK